MYSAAIQNRNGELGAYETLGSEIVMTSRRTINRNDVTLNYETGVKWTP